MTEPRYQLTEDVQLAIAASQAIATELGHAQVEPEDLLLAALRSELVIRALAGISVDARALGERLFNAAPRGKHFHSGQRRYSARAGRPMMRLWKEAKGLGQSHADTISMLVALLQPPPSRFLFLFRRRVPPFWQEIHRVGLDRARVIDGLGHPDGAA